MVRTITTVALDLKFFNNVFEKEIVRMQKKMGLSNLSHANFTKMIQGLKIKQPKQDFFQMKNKRKNVKI